MEDLRLGRGTSGEAPALLNIDGDALIGGVTIFTGNVDVNGGTVDSIELLGDDAVLDLTGGNVGFVSTTNGGGIVNLRGGSITETVNISTGAELNIFGSGFFLDGVSLDDTLTLNEAFTLPDRDSAVLTATLTDGSAFEVVLFEGFSNSSLDRIRSGATLTLTLIASAIAGDYNNDGFVGQADLDLVLLNFGDTVLPEGFNTAALPGGTFDDLIGQNELDAVLLNFGAGSAVDSAAITAVPEPTSAALIVLGGVAVATRRRRSA